MKTDSDSYPATCLGVFSYFFFFETMCRSLRDRKEAAWN